MTSFTLNITLNKPTPKPPFSYVIYVLCYFLKFFSTYRIVASQSLSRGVFS